jgi:Uncharacterized conserved protein
MKFVYPAIFTEEDGNYIVEFPDLEGCLTYGESIEDALVQAEEALEGYLVVLLENEQLPVKASNVKTLNVSNGFATLVSCDIDMYKETKAVKKTLTIPSWLNKLATDNGVNFSEVLRESLVKQLIRN